MIDSMRYLSPIGPLLLAGEGEHLVGLWMEGQKYFGATLRETPLENGGHPVLRAAREWLDRYFAGEKPAVSELSLAPAGSGFRQQVWELLCRIPYGQVVTYGQISRELAERTGKAVSAQAVGGAVGHNPISIIIPCHRVVGASGSLTGYAGGVEKKLALLRLEGADLSGLTVPTRGTAV